LIYNSIMAKLYRDIYEVRLPAMYLGIVSIITEVRQLNFEDIMVNDAIVRPCVGT